MRRLRQARKRTGIVTWKTQRLLAPRMWSFVPTVVNCGTYLKPTCMGAAPTLTACGGPDILADSNRTRAINAWRAYAAYLMTWSARTRIDVGTVRPIDCAVRRLIARRMSEGSWKGSSPILAPRRMRAT